MLLYALIASILTSILPIINKRLLADTDVSVVSWAFNALSLPLLGVSTWFLSAPTRVDSLFWIGVVSSGVLNVAATLLSTQALRLGDASLVTPFLTFNPVFTLVVALFVLREIPTANGTVGVLLIAAGARLFAIREVHVGFIAPLGPCCDSAV